MIKVYEYLREALESRKIRVPAIVIDSVSGSFVAKRIIAAIWLYDEVKVKRDFPILEYNNVRQIIFNSNKDILSEHPAEPTRLETDPGTSSSSRRSAEEINNARQTLDRFTTEEQRAISGRDLGNEWTDDEIEEPEPEHAEFEHEASLYYEQDQTPDQVNANDENREQNLLPRKVENQHVMLMMTEVLN